MSVATPSPPAARPPVGLSDEIIFAAAKKFSFCLARTRPDDASREAYLRSLFAEVYLKDIVERHAIAKPAAMGQIVDFLCSSTGSRWFDENGVLHLSILDFLLDPSALS